MNRTDRLLAILLHLRTRRYTRAEDIAAHVEVSVRTIYRDVLALCEAGVPVVATPGQGYMLQDGYFLPPVMLTPDEASALLLGASFVAAQVDAPYRVSVETARAKVEKLLPEATRQTVEALHDSLRFIGAPATLSPLLDSHLTTIRHAIEEGAVLALTYHARHGAPSEREVEPYGLVFVDGRWLFAAYCRTRKDMRSFRLDRVEAVEPTGQRFARRPGFSVRSLPEMRQGAAIVVVKLAPSLARWARENRPPTFMEEVAHPDGVVMTFKPRDLQDILPWVLGWGAGAQVLSPPEARDRVRDEVAALSALYADPSVPTLEEATRATRADVTEPACDEESRRQKEVYVDAPLIGESTTTEGGYAITVTDHEDEADRLYVGNGLTAFNATASPSFSPEALAEEFPRVLDVFVRDEEGRILGGIIGQTHWGWLSIELVWLDASLRGHGWGTRLMRLCEEEARRRGITRAHLTTFGFQARGFYVKMGYRVVGQLDDFPPRSTRYWLRKDFADASFD